MSRNAKIRLAASMTVFIVGAFVIDRVGHTAGPPWLSLVLTGALALGAIRLAPRERPSWLELTPREAAMMGAALGLFGGLAFVAADYFLLEEGEYLSPLQALPITVVLGGGTLLFFWWRHRD